MTDTNQNLREALRELMSIVSIHQKATRNNFAWAEMDFAREALALPTAAPVGDLPELPEPAEYFVFAGLDWHRATAAYFNSCSGEKLVLYTADQMRAYARAALSAGDAEDGPLIDEGSKPALSPLSDKAAIALIEEHTNDENVIHAHEAIDLIRSVERAHGIDAAMRKGQL